MQFLPWATFSYCWAGSLSFGTRHRESHCPTDSSLEWYISSFDFENKCNSVIICKFYSHSYPRQWRSFEFQKELTFVHLHHWLSFLNPCPIFLKVLFINFDLVVAGCLCYFPVKCLETLLEETNMLSEFTQMFVWYCCSLWPQWGHIIVEAQAMLTVAHSCVGNIIINHW